MAVNAKLYGIFAGAAGDHALGSATKDAGVTVSGGVLTFDRSKSHNWQPRGPDGTTATTAPAGYTKLAVFYGFEIARDSVAPAASYVKAQTNGPTPAFQLTEDTSRVWTFKVAGTSIPGSYTPPDSNRHHVLIYITKVSGGSYLSTWSPSDTLWVTILVDKSIQFNDAVTASTSNAVGVKCPTFGQTATDANSPTFTVKNVAFGYSDRSNPIGKVTCKEWGFSLGVAPPAGHDQSVKSTGTDAAALVDERPPGGSGTTDVDWYQLIDDGTHLSQHSALTNTLLAAGDAMYGAVLKQWSRQNTSSKLSGAAGQMHDGTTNKRNGGNALVTGPTSYAEVLFASDGGGGSQDDLYFLAPDGNAWGGKTNTYLDGCFAGCYMNGASANASIFIDALLVEVAVVLSGDSISAIADPGTTVTTQRRRGGVV